MGERRQSLLTELLQHSQQNPNSFSNRKMWRAKTMPQNRHLLRSPHKLCTPPKTSGSFLICFYMVDVFQPRMHTNLMPLFGTGGWHMLAEPACVAQPSETSLERASHGQRCLWEEPVRAVSDR